MNHGRVEQVGTPSTVYDAPQSAYVAGFIGQQNFFSGIVDRSDGGAVGITVEGCRIVTSRPTGLGVGSDATLAVRPEHVTVSATAETGANAIPATLMGVSQLGSALQLVLLTAGGAKITARASRSVEVPTTIGSTVWCRWDATSVHVFPGSAVA
jgi:spermidine/putrescine transport system ATP-binding protein